MSKWNYTLNIKLEWQASKEGTISLKELTNIIIKKLTKVNDLEDDITLQMLIEDFQALFESEEEISTVDFDSIWSQVYDWADQTIDSSVWPHKKMCLIITS